MISHFLEMISKHKTNSLYTICIQVNLTETKNLFNIVLVSRINDEDTNDYFKASYVIH